LLETAKEESLDVVAQLVVSENDIISIREFSQNSVIHKLSHQHLHIKFWEIKVKGRIENGVGFDAASAFPFPVVLYNFIENHYR